MKTIKSVRATKGIEVGTIKRVGEKEADSEVRGGYWKYVPKSEYKGEKKVEEQPKEEKQPKTKKNEKTSK
jgi:hypothetical protein